MENHHGINWKTHDFYGHVQVRFFVSLPGRVNHWFDPMG